jgi:hypothetical protein
VWCEEFEPESFWTQTAQTFTAALRGRLESRRRGAERDLTLAYWTGAFSRASKVRDLDHYLQSLRAPQDGSKGGMAVFSALKELKARGLPVEIKRLN